MTNQIKPYCFLVVEDNPGDFILLEQYFKKSSLRIEKIIHTDKMADVPALIKENDFDLVMLDLTLPDSNGVDSVITLDRLLPDTPIVVFSGISTVETAVQCITLGAQDYLIKGEFDVRLLAKTVQYSIERKKITQNLKEINERYELATYATNDVVWDWHITTNRMEMSNSIYEVFGHPTQHADLEWYLEKVHPQEREKVFASLNEDFEKKLSNWNAEYRFRCANGSYKEVMDRGYILFDENGKPYRMIGAMTDMSEKRKLERELSEQQLNQQKLITEVTIQAQEKERNELGRELHDNINQILATVKMYLGMVRSGEDFKEDLLSKCYDHVNEAIAEIRKLSHSLVAPSLGDIGLKEALEELAEDTNSITGLQLQLEVDEKLKQLKMDKSKELMLYRIVQEQLSNVIKYAKANEVMVTLHANDGHLLLAVSDDGDGFDTSKKARGIGLKNISSRAEFYSGNMNIISSPGKGCRLEVSLPV